MLNVEFKAELRDPALAKAALGAIGAKFVGELLQTDTYFRVGAGRLKRRETVGQPVQYVVYDRADAAAPKVSQYELLTQEQARVRFGEAELPVWLVVRKKRLLYMFENVRVHLDTVDSLGEFLEFEAMVSEERGLQACHASVVSLRERLGPALGEPISGGYSDMLARLGESCTR